MAYNVTTEFPALLVHDDLNGDITVATFGRVKVAGGVIANNDDTNVLVVFRDGGDANDRLKVAVPAGESVHVPRFESEGGLLVQTLGATVGPDIHVTLFAPTVAG